jgi:hypothetical protein
MLIGQQEMRGTTYVLVAKGFFSQLKHVLNVDVLRARKHG